ncbi:hypothetical protein ACTFIW_012112 [Dictyostelium discoideum]
MSTPFRSDVSKHLKIVKLETFIINRTIASDWLDKVQLLSTFPHAHEYNIPYSGQTPTVTDGPTPPSPFLSTNQRDSSPQFLSTLLSPPTPSTLHQQLSTNSTNLP